MNITVSLNKLTVLVKLFFPYVEINGTFKMKRLFEFEVITTTGAHSFQIPHTLDHRKFRKDLKKFIKCDDVTLVVYTTVDSKGNMLKDRKFCNNIKDIKI